MESKLYVGNISWNATEENLRELFETCGEVVDAKIIKDRDSGRSKGFGFVEMGSKEDADKAIAELNDKDLLGRNLKVNVAKPKQPRKNFGGRKY
jgi:RNA recognition motif-containing protein